MFWMSSADAETCAVFSRGNSHSIRLPVFEWDLPTEMNAQEGLENETLYQLDSCPLQRILVLLFSSSLEFLSPSRHLSYFPHCHAKPNAFPLIRRPSLFERTEVRGAMAEPWDYEEMLANKERRDSQCSPSCISLWHLFVPNWRGWRRHVRAEASTPEKLQASSAAGHCYSEKKTRCGTLIQSIFAETHSVL